MIRYMIALAIILLLTAAQQLITLRPGESLLYECTSGVHSDLPYEGNVRRIACYSSTPPCDPMFDDCNDLAHVYYFPIVGKTQ